jgi:hypothetical protein
MHLLGFANVVLLVTFFTFYLVHLNRLSDLVHPLTSTQSGFEAGLEFLRNAQLRDSPALDERSKTLGMTGCSILPQHDAWDMVVSAEPYTSDACACLDEVLMTSIGTNEDRVQKAFQCFFRLDAGASVELAANGMSIGLMTCVLVWNLVATIRGILEYLRSASDGWLKNSVSVFPWISYVVCAVVIMRVEGWNAWMVAALIPAICITLPETKGSVAYVVLPFLLLILSVVRQQRDVWYILYVVLFAFGMVYSNLACQHAIEEEEKKDSKDPKPFTKRVINAACVANVLTGFVFLSISIPVLQPRDGMGFQTIRGVAFVATMLLLFIPLTNTSVLPAKLRDDPKLFLEMGARFIITTAAIVDLTA